jgi:hypothetical protein
LIAGAHAEGRQPIAGAQAAVVDDGLRLLVNEKPKVTSFLIMMDFYFMLIKMNFFLTVRFAFVV